MSRKLQPLGSFQTSALKSRAVGKGEKVGEEGGHRNRDTNTVATFTSTEVATSQRQLGNPFWVQKPKEVEVLTFRKKTATPARGR